MTTQEEAAHQVQPGMVVETTEGDLGESDLSKPEVKEVVRDPSGNVDRIVLKKGMLFQKEIEVPADRIQAVDAMPHDPTAAGKVTIAASADETEALAATGAEPLAAVEDGDLLAQTEEALPTDAGMRRLEEQHAAPPRPRAATLLRLLGPGFLAGMAGNDSSAVTTYAIDGAAAGYGTSGSCC